MGDRVPVVARLSLDLEEAKFERPGSQMHAIPPLGHARPGDHPHGGFGCMCQQ